MAYGKAMADIELTQAEMIMESLLLKYFFFQFRQFIHCNA